VIPRTISARKFASLLRSLGFEEDHSKDHIFFYFLVQGRIVTYTKISHGTREISQPLLGLIGKQLKLNRQEFADFLQGKTNREEYENLLRHKRMC
jgi:hypothetical protein